MTLKDSLIELFDEASRQGIGSSKDWRNKVLEMEDERLVFKSLDRPDLEVKLSKNKPPISEERLKKCTKRQREFINDAWRVSRIKYGDSIPSFSHYELSRNGWTEGSSRYHAKNLCEKIILEKIDGGDFIFVEDSEVESTKKRMLIKKSSDSFSLVMCGDGLHTLHFFSKKLTIEEVQVLADMLLESIPEAFRETKAYREYIKQREEQQKEAKNGTDRSDTEERSEGEGREGRRDGDSAKPGRAA